MRKKYLLFILIVCVFVTAGIGRAVASVSHQNDTQYSDQTQSVVEQIPPPQVSAKAWLIYDETSDEPVASEDPSTARPIASLAKLMTALLTVERCQQNDTVKIPTTINQLPADAATMGLKAGETWSVHDLLLGLLVVSANDAAISLATAVSDNETSFVKLMNKKANELDLSRTKFASASGLDLKGPMSVSSPADLVVLAQQALKDKDIAYAVKQERVELVRPHDSTTQGPIVLTHRHPLVGNYPGVNGVKTGFTDKAGYMLITNYVNTDTDSNFMIITAASSSEKTRSTDTKALLDWVRPLRQNVTVAEAGTNLARVPVEHLSKKVNLFLCDDATVSARADQLIHSKIVVPTVIKPPISAGDEIGELRISVSGADDKRVPLCSSKTIHKVTSIQRARRLLAEYDKAWHEGTKEVRSTWQKIAG